MTPRRSRGNEVKGVAFIKLPLPLAGWLSQFSSLCEIVRCAQHAEGSSSRVIERVSSRPSRSSRRPRVASVAVGGRTSAPSERDVNY